MSKCSCFVLSSIALHYVKYSPNSGLFRHVFFRINKHKIDSLFILGNTEQSKNPYSSILYVVSFNHDKTSEYLLQFLAWRYLQYYIKKMVYQEYTTLQLLLWRGNSFFVLHSVLYQKVYGKMTITVCKFFFNLRNKRNFIFIDVIIIIIAIRFEARQP